MDSMIRAVSDILRTRTYSEEKQECTFNRI
jgi:hypothetical protein